MGDGISDNGWGLKSKGPCSNQVRRVFLLGGIDTWDVACYAMGVIEDVHKLVLRWMVVHVLELQNNLSVCLSI